MTADEYRQKKDELVNLTLLMDKAKALKAKREQYKDIYNDVNSLYNVKELYLSLSYGTHKAVPMTKECWKKVQSILLEDLEQERLRLDDEFRELN